MRKRQTSGMIARLAVATLCGAASLAEPPLARAEPAAAAAPTACGFALSDPIAIVWRDLGAESGRLGCPTEKESATSTSPRGSAARAAVFGQNGEILLHVSGPRAGQAFAVWGCSYRLYVQFGGSSGWLGLPLDEAANTPDGSRQTFEGGTIQYTRAYDSCEATPAEPSTRTAVAAAAEAPLDLFENASTGDRLSLASAGAVDQALAAGYRRLRGQARVLTEAASGATALKLFENDADGRRETLAATLSETDALAAGFAFEATQGFVWIDPRPGAVPLKLYLRPADGRARLTAGPLDEREAADGGFRFVRVEGYADPAQ